MEDEIVVPYYISEEQRLIDINRQILETMLPLQKKGFYIHQDHLFEYNKNVDIIMILRNKQPMTKEEYDQIRNISNT